VLIASVPALVMILAMNMYGGAPVLITFYAIKEIFKPNGIYGRWGWRGLVAYLAGFAASAPF
jgi:hypothetical protein